MEQTLSRFSHTPRLALAVLGGLLLVGASTGAHDGGPYTEKDHVDQLLGRAFTIGGSPGQFLIYPTPQAAATAGGVPLLMPSTPPFAEATPNSYLITQRAMTVTVDLSQLNLSGAEDLRARFPSPATGSTTLTRTVTATPLVELAYLNGNNAVYFVQTSASDVILPPYVSLPLLTEIRLVMLGIGPFDAWRFANAIDWRAAMLVPVPTSIAWINEVTVNGTNALVIQGSGVFSNTTAVLWAKGGELLGLEGTVGPAALVTIARSVP